MPWGTCQQESPVSKPITRWWVTFKDILSIATDDSCLLVWADKMAWGDHSDQSQTEPEDLECLATFDPWVQEFLTGEEMPGTSNECKDDPNQPRMPKPSLEDSNNWILWCAHQVETPSWWLELWEVPNLQEGYGHHFRCQRQGAMPQRWRMTSWCHLPLTALKGIHSCPSTICSLASKTTI